MGAFTIFMIVLGGGVAPVTSGSHCIVASQCYGAGAQRGDVFAPGDDVGEVYAAGARSPR